jgi:hypothetical protein
MGHIDPANYRADAYRCRTISSSSGNRREWVRFSQEWEKLAELAEVLSADRLNCANDETNESPALLGAGSCGNPRKTLLLAGVFCARRAPGYYCEPLFCEMSELASRPQAASTESRRMQQMRRLVEPSPSMKCKLCGGELLLKSFEPDAPVVEIDVAIYRCAKCGHEQARQVTHDPYASHAKRR